MKRLFAWLSGAAGGIALYRFLERRPAPAAELPAGPDPRAEELRAKLDEQELPEPQQPEPQLPESQAAEVSPEPPAQQPDAGSAADDPETRRRRVHEQGRATVHRMRGSG